MGRVDLGLAESDFWGLTLRQFAAMLARARERERREDLRAGTIAALLANTNRDRKRRPDPFSAVDFFPSLAPEPETPADRSEMLAKKAVRITELLGGTVVKRKKVST